MFGVHIKRLLASLYGRSCVGGCKKYLVRSGPKLALLNDVRNIQHLLQTSPVPFGLLAGCCFSKQTGDSDSDTVATHSAGILHQADDGGHRRGMVDQRNQYGSLGSDVCSKTKGIVDDCVDGLSIVDAESTYVSRKNADQSTVGATSTGPSKRLSSEVTSGCKSKYPKLDQGKREHYVRVCGNQPALSATSCSSSIVTVAGEVFPASSTDNGMRCNVDGTDPDSPLGNVKTCAPSKRLSSDVINDCKPKYQKFDDEMKELDNECSISQPEAKCSDTHNILKDVMPTNDAEILKKEEISDVPKDKGAPSTKSKKKAKERPNYFISMKISNPVIHKALEAVQAHITDQDARLKPSIVPLGKLHLTLMVIYLSNDEEHEKALSVLESFYEGLNEDICKSPLTLEFSGLGTFNDKVLFAKVKAGDSLDRLNNIVKDVIEHFKEASIIPTDKKGFNSHLTVMKLSRSPKLYRQGIKKINPSLYSTYKDHVFGSEEIKSIELLSMTGAEDASGYYKGHQLLFGDAARGGTRISPYVLLGQELQDHKSKITQLAQQQIERMTLSSSNKDVPPEITDSSDVK